MKDKKICEYCGKEIKDGESACRNGRYDEPHYTGEPVWHLDCYEKEHDEAREFGFI